MTRAFEGSSPAASDLPSAVLASALLVERVSSGSWVGALPLRATAVEVGRYWDAVRLPVDIASAVYEHMVGATQGAPGPVLVSPSVCWHYWLVRPGSTANWSFPSVVCRSTGAWLTVVSAGRTTGPGPHWLVPPTADGRLAHAVLLHSVIRTVVGP